MAQYKKELESAIRRSVTHGFLENKISIGGTPKITPNSSTAICAAILHSWPRDDDGSFMTACRLCAPLAVKMLPVIRNVAGQQAWLTLGWVTDQTAYSHFWRSPTELLVDFIKNPRGPLFEAEFHVWLSLGTGEGVDVSIYQALGELFPNKFHKQIERYAMIHGDGHGHKMAGFPTFRYHPQLVLGDHMIGRVAIWE